MQIDLDRINSYANRLERYELAITYRIRVDIERSLFVVSSIISKDFFGYPISGFNPAMKALIHSQHTTDERITILRHAFEIRNILRIIAISKPYYVDDLAGPQLSGRRELQNALARSMYRFTRTCRSWEERRKGGGY